MRVDQLPSHHSSLAINFSAGPGPSLNFFTRTYGPKFDNKNVGNNFLGIHK